MNDKEYEKNDKKYKIIIGGLVFIVLILLGLLIYIANKKTNNNNNSNSTTTSSTTTTSTTTTTTTTTTTHPKNLATNFNIFPLNDDSDVIRISVGDLYEANVDTETNFKSVNLKKGNINYSAKCKYYDETYKKCGTIEFNINNTLVTLPEETTDGGVYLMVKNNNIVLVRFASTCANLEIYRNSKLAYTVDHISTYNDTLLKYLESKKEAVYESDTIKYANNKLHYLVDTIDGYTILKTIDLTKDKIIEEEIAKVKDNQRVDLNCYNNDQI